MQKVRIFDLCLTSDQVLLKSTVRFSEQVFGLGFESRTKQNQQECYEVTVRFGGHIFE
ncbi:hypothetical protein M079_0431 [Bacteroides fragilis str. 3996 N(B) 6]|nr:hypothetical protein M079_0431 [Bacteroides fragilis str. 3996 N(B) 6]